MPHVALHRVGARQLRGMQEVRLQIRRTGNQRDVFWNKSVASGQFPVAVQVRSSAVNSLQLFQRYSCG